MSLDFTVAERQSFGTTFHAPTVKKLLAGKLTMTPHPEWTLPDVIDWTADPFEDVNWQNQYHMLRWLDPLRRAAMKGDDAAYDMWIRYVRDWVQNNPRSNPAHQWVWRDMVEGIRVIQFCLAAPLVRNRSPEDLGWLEATIREHAEFMADPANLGKANHAMHQHEALFVCGRILRDQKFTDLAIKRFDQLLNEEYDEQGVNGEGAIAYHYNNYLWYERALKRFDAEGAPRPAAAERHARAPEEIAHATRPDGTFVSIGDTDGGTAQNVRSPFTDYVTSGGAKGEPPADLLKIYDRGYLFARSGWGETEKNLDEETFFSVSFGAANRVHGHPDGGSITFSADTVNWLVDPGKFQYGYSIPRKHLVSRASHSLVSIEGRTPRKDAVVELSRRAITDRAYDFLFSDSSFEGVTLTRRVIYSTAGEYLVIVDHVRSRDDVTAIQRWQLGPDVDASITRHRAELASGECRASLSYVGTATQLSQLRGQNSPFDGWVATGWKQKTEATVVNASKRGKNFRFITVLASGNTSSPAVENVPGTERGYFCLRVSTGKVTEMILVGRDAVTFPTSPPTSGSIGADTEKAPTFPTASGKPHFQEKASRREVFEKLEASRLEAWDAPVTRREELANELNEEQLRKGLHEPVDLGLAAGIADLRSLERGHSNPKLIEPKRTSLVNWDGVSDWRPTFYPLPVVSHRNSGSINIAPAGPAIHSIIEGPFVVPFAIDPRAGTTLTVLFQGAVDRAKVRIPIFLRWRHQLELNAGPTMAIADPTLDLSTSLRLGWYLGTEKLDLAPRLAELVKSTARSLGAQNIVLVGSSGGGFAALQMGAHIPGSTVVAMSPQTDLRRYPPRLVGAATEPAFGLRKAPTDGYLIKRINVAERMQNTRHYPRAWIVSNSGDSHHVTEHESPLREHYASAGQAESLLTLDIDLGQGHRSVDNETYTRVLTEVYSTLP
ncbi:hypothetical protein CFK38_04660 [Brachybacterium vulturis]|uniref:Uncharacterized protein n=1 Tax=Brachybacterium vulturis TaxID=2017484 RepID=A0A291GL16_9MICO|nr:heparinase II/III family protein [Brachybacterium vulturis]ATG50897.1 hypothetical protein CFK38_04660 [Brachybacterium vulturis]